MPPIRRSNLGRITRNAINQANYRLTKVNKNVKEFVHEFPPHEK